MQKLGYSIWKICLCLNSLVNQENQLPEVLCYCLCSGSLGMLWLIAVGSLLPLLFKVLQQPWLSSPEVQRILRTWSNQSNLCQLASKPCLLLAGAWKELRSLKDRFRLHHTPGVFRALQCVGIGTSGIGLCSREVRYNLMTSCHAKSLLFSRCSVLLWLSGGLHLWFCQNTSESKIFLLEMFHLWAFRLKIGGGFSIKC